MGLKKIVEFLRKISIFDNTNIIEEKFEVLWKLKKNNSKIFLRNIFKTQISKKLGLKIRHKKSPLTNSAM